MKVRNALIFLIIFAISISLVSCSTTYEPVESTEEEQKTVCTVSVGGETYHVRYELYRALFLTYKSEIDGGDASVWNSDSKDEYIEKINAIIIPKIADIYATIAACEETGFNLYSKDVDKKLKEYVKESVEGGVYDSVVIKGYGSYDAYLAALKARGSNYSVEMLLFRYAIAAEVVENYYFGTLNDDNFTPDATEGKIKYTESDVRAFYDSADCIRIHEGFVQKIFGIEHAELMRERIIEKADGGYDVGIAMIGHNLTSDEDGIVVGKYSRDVSFYEEYTKAAFELAVGKTSDVISVTTGYDDGYFILHRVDKTDKFYTDNYKDIVSVYLDNELGKIIAEKKNELLSSIEYTKDYSALDFGAISMN